MSLTEKWKNGELPYGHYYVIFDKNDTPEISRCVSKVTNLSKPAVRDFEDFGVEKVLAPVPDYEELERLKEKLDEALKSSAHFEMKAYDLERDLKSAKSHNQYYLKSIKNMTSALDYMMDENEKLQVKYNEDTDKLMRQIVNGREWEKLAKSAYPYRCDTIVGGVSFITIKEENKNFRNLLKECLPYMDIYKISRNEEAKELLNRIEAAIVESEE